MRILVMALLSFLCLASPSSAHTVFPYYGDTGTTGSVDECQPGQYFVGVVGATGLWTDQITVVCGQLTPDNSITGSKTIASRGGSGGNFKSVLRGKDEVITQMWVNRTEHYQVSFTQFTCSNVKTGATHNISFGGTERSAGGVPGATMTCPAGELGTGMTIRWGKYVNGLGLVCNGYKPPAPTPVVTAPPATSPSPTQTPPAQTPQAFAKVLLDVDVYNTPCGADNAKKTGTILKAGTSNVKVLLKKAPWFQVQWPSGSGCVYSGPGWVSLQVP